MGNDYFADVFYLFVTGILIILNGFFVAAEFALVKVNRGKIKTMEKNNNPFAPIVQWLYERQNMALSACQMGITMASLALGWIGEPAMAHLLRPLFQSLGIASEAILHGLAFAIAFTLITSFHIVIGEQFPKIYAIRNPISIMGWSSVPLKIFYIVFYPFMWGLDRITSKLLKLVGVDDSLDHETVLTEDEIRTSLGTAYRLGNLSKQEHRLLDGAFSIDDQTTRQIMLPRSEIVFVDLLDSYDECLKLVRKSKHTRFPLCEGSLDQIKGIIHIKDLVGSLLSNTTDLKKYARKPVFVPDSLPVVQLLQIFRNKKQHMAFVEDEYGTIIGIVTLENVIELLVGSVQDEFDFEKPDIIAVSEFEYIVEGDVPLSQINLRLDAGFEAEEADTLSGYLLEHTEHHLEEGKIVELNNGITAEILSIKNRRARKVKLLLPKSE